MKRLNTESAKEIHPSQATTEIFPQGGEEKDLTYQRGGSRRRAYTVMEAAEAEETEAQRRRHASIEAKKMAQHEGFLRQDEGLRNKGGFLQDFVAVVAVSQLTMTTTTGIPWGQRHAGPH